MTEADQALRALRERDQAGMGRVAGDEGVETARLADLEACVKSVRHWSPLLISAVLQTSAYAAGAVHMATPSLSSVEVGERVRQRKRRSAMFLQRFKGRGDGHAWIVVSDVAIARPLVNAHAHAQQLRHLLNIIEGCERLTLQVAPEEPAPPGGAGEFSIYTMTDGPRVGYLSSLVGGWYTTHLEDIARLHSAFSAISDQALPPSESKYVIEEALAEWNTHSPEPHGGRLPTPTMIVSKSLTKRPAPSE